MEAALNDDMAGAWEDLTDLLQSDEISPRSCYIIWLWSNCGRLRHGRMRTKQMKRTHTGSGPGRRGCAGWQPQRPPSARVLLDWLLEQHQQRVNDLLARNRIDQARRHWNLVLGLPDLAANDALPLVPDLTSRVERFRDQLATQYLVTTREAMRYGAIAEGMRADYDKGLIYLRRLLSLDHDSIRLLTALIEICGEYFLDLVQVGTPHQLVEQVERFLPFALQLIRLTENQSGQLAATAALAEFYKFRGFITRDRNNRSIYIAKRCVSTRSTRMCARS